MADISVPIDMIKLLTFCLDEEQYALDITTVREIRSQTETTLMPHAPAYLVGLTNLRGMILPVIDLGLRLGLPQVSKNDRNVIIVTAVEDKFIGLLVDSVTDIVAVPLEELHKPPITKKRDTGLFERAICLVNEKMVRLLEVGAIVQ